jgi:2-keto-4-pentenoate hydratase/2-oxohepta-3-ene-1,7-dioic acid hydratase in catechol pathway
MKHKSSAKKDFGKRLVPILAVIIFIQLFTTLEAQMIYCRYEYNSHISYGQVDDQILHQLDAAPWTGGRQTGIDVSLSEVKLLHPSEPQVILGLGGSYKDTWKNNSAPSAVRWFLKPPGAAASPGDDVVIPKALDQIKVETELVIVIGKVVKDANEATAEAAIFGYTIGNDIVGWIESYHRLQGEPVDQPEDLLAPGLKVGDRFAPFGPFIYTDFDWRNRERTLTLTNKNTGKNIEYSHNTSNLGYTPAKIVSDLSQILTLSPGDIIMTGTTKSFVADAGDVVTISIEGMGSLTNQVTK